MFPQMFSSLYGSILEPRKVVFGVKSFFFLINIRELSILIQTRIHFSLSTLSSYGRLTEESNSALINNKDIKITNIYIGMEIIVQNYTNVYVHVHPNFNW